MRRTVVSHASPSVVPVAAPRPGSFDKLSRALSLAFAVALAACCVACAGSGLLEQPAPLPEMPALGDAVPLPEDPARQFDFWWGEWNVKNLQLDGETFGDAGSAVARIHPVADGAATLEQWDGTLRGDALIGSSLRAWDPALGRWVIWLNWHGGSPGGFFVMHGSRDGERLDQFPPDDDSQLRYGFSRAHADSCQWDEARSNDGGETWITTWVMQFTRRGPPRALDARNAPIVQPPPAASENAVTRELDFLIGAWEGTATVRGDDGSELETDVRVRVTTMIDGFALAQFVDSGDGEKSLAVLGWDPAADGWLAIRSGNRSSGLARLAGEIEAREATFADGGLREHWSCSDADRCRFVRSTSEDGTTWSAVLEAELSRSASSAAWIDFPKARAPFADLLSGGQPSLEQLERMAQEGYRTVINLRSPGEPEELAGEAEHVAALGMKYLSIPIASGDDLTVENARRLADTLALPDALPAVVHCRSGNRVGALFALKALELDGADAEQAFEVGRSAGLTSLAPLVRERLGLPAE